MKIINYIIVLLHLNNIENVLLFKLNSKYIINKHNSLCLYDQNNNINNEIDKFKENRIPRLGRSKDEDGKSNIWSVEPKMEVIEENDYLTEGNKNILITGLLFTSFIITIPLFYIFTTLLPDY